MSDRTDNPRRAGQPPLSRAAARRIDAITPLNPTAQPTDSVVLLMDRTTVGDVDLIAVERAVNGKIRPSQLTRAERQAAARILTNRGHTSTFVFHRTGVSARRQDVPTSARRAPDGEAA